MSHNSDRKANLETDLIDQGLREILGGESPPDLTSQIMAAKTAVPVKPVPSSQSYRVSPIVWMVGLAAVMLVGLFILPNVVKTKNRRMVELSADLADRESLVEKLVERQPNRLSSAPTEFSLQPGAADRTAEDKSSPTGILAGEGEPAIVSDGESFDYFEQEEDFGLAQQPISERKSRRSFAAPISGPEASPGNIARTKSDMARGPESESRTRHEPSFVENEPEFLDLAEITRPHANTDLDALAAEPSIGGYGGPEPTQTRHRRGGGREFYRGKRILGRELWVTPRHVERYGGESGDRYKPIHENEFVATKGTAAVSTFSIDVDTAAYTNVRQFLNSGSLPPPDAVRLEELVNYFEYDYAGPAADSEHPFASHVEIAGCPWNDNHRLVRIGIKARSMGSDKRPKSNLVFLIDVSGSMDDPNKLPLVIDGLKHLTRELGENDRVAIAVYASAEGLALPSTRGDRQDVILGSLNRLSAGGSTAGGAGIKLAYQVAAENYIQGGVNRVILCTDGDFNVGTTSTDELQRLAEQKAAETKTFLTVLGFGRGNLNDAMMETISNKGNGNYFYVDNLREIRRVLVHQLNSTLATIAKDVKIQVEFNPANVASYRLLGYENRVLAREDFDDDTKDAGEIGAGHTVTALYEVVPTGAPAEATTAGALKYQPQKEVAPDTQPNKGDEKEVMDAFDDELLTLSLRYKPPTGDTSTKIEVAVKDESQGFDKASEDFRFASSVAGFGMLLRGSQHKGAASYDLVREMAVSAMGKDQQGYRAEFVELIDKAKRISR